MKYFYLNKKAIPLMLILTGIGMFWIGLLHDFSVVDTALGICGVVVMGLLGVNLTEGLKRAGKQLYYANIWTLAKTNMMGLVLTLSLLYVCKIPYHQDYLTYGLIVGTFAAVYKEYQVRQARGFKIHFDVLLLNDGTYSIGTNNRELEVQDEIQELSEQRLRDPIVITDKLFRILGKYESRSPEEMRKRRDIEVNIDRIIRG